MYNELVAWIDEALAQYAEDAPGDDGQRIDDRSQALHSRASLPLGKGRRGLVSIAAISAN